MPVRLAEFKRRAQNCTTFQCINHKNPHLSGPRTIRSIGPAAIQYVIKGFPNTGRTEWPKAGLYRIEGNKITWLHDGDGSDCFTYIFPFDSDAEPRHLAPEQVNALLAGATAVGEHQPNGVTVWHQDGWRRMVGQTSSKDLIHWTPFHPVVVSDPEASGFPEFYGMKPMVRGGLYIGFLRTLRDDLPADEGGPVHGIGWTELCTSRNGEDWRRHRGTFVDRNRKPGTWDHAMAWVADCITAGDKELIYYCGYAKGHRVGSRQMGIATLRKNRLGSQRGIVAMAESSLPPEIRQLPVSERIELVEQIWDSIVEDQGQFELTDAQKAELDRRLAAHEESPERGASWPDVKSRLLGD